MKGKVKFFNEEKGYGFILGEDDKEYFVHRSGVQEGVELNNDDPVEFELKETDRGMNAVEVRLGTEEPSAAEHPDEELDKSVEESSEPEAAEEESETAEESEEAEPAEEEKPEAAEESEEEKAA